MKFLKQLVFTMALCWILQYFLPWWTLIIGAFVAGWWAGNKPLESFFAGFLAVGLLWLMMALMVDMQTQSELINRVARLLPTKTPLLLFVVTAVVGGLPAGFAALTGALLKR